MNYSKKCCKKCQRINTTNGNFRLHCIDTDCRYHQDKKCEKCGAESTTDLCAGFYCEKYPDFATPKNSEWETRLENEFNERFGFGIWDSRATTGHRKEGISSTSVLEFFRAFAQSLLQDRSQDTVGELIERLGDKFGGLQRREDGWFDVWSKTDLNRKTVKIYLTASTPLEALQKLSEQIEQK